MKFLAVFFEAVFILAIISILLKYFNIEIVGNTTFWPYVIGGISFLISLILRKKINTQTPNNSI